MSAWLNANFITVCQINAMVMQGIRTITAFEHDNTNQLTFLLNLMYGIKGLSGAFGAGVF